MPGRPRWIPKILARIHPLAASRRLRLTAKADQELIAFGGELDQEDVRDILLGLTAGDFIGRQASRSTREWLYVFKPRVGAEVVYVKTILRGECVIVSFHEDESSRDDEGKEST